MLNSELVISFLKEASELELNFVHWKSNTNIDKALCGDDDLDLLLDKKEVDKITIIFEKLNIIKVASYKDTWQSGIENYIGFDTTLNKLIHFHIHYSLPVGYDFDKNFIMPIVDDYLSSSSVHKGIRLPSYEYEYILLVLRLILKNGLVPFSQHIIFNKIKIIKQSRQKGVICGGGYKEYLDLKDKVDPSKVEHVLNKSFKFVSNETFKKCEATLNTNDSLISYFRACSKLEKELAHLKNNTTIKSYCLSLLRINLSRVKTFKKRVFSYNSFGKKSDTGGRIFAFVGGDGAGKSTTIDNLYKTLSRHFQVYKIHVGRPRKSFSGLLVKVINRLCRPIVKREFSLALSYLALAFDRRKEFVRACKLRNKGAIVLLDRIPLDGITTMDCPRVKMNCGDKFEFISNLEEKIYKEIKGVDQLFVLKLDPQIALKRRPEDEPNELLKRSGQIWNNHWNAPSAFEINTGVTSITDVQSLILSEVNKILCKEYKLIEIAGLNGTGKSTLIEMVMNNNGNVSKNLPIKDYKLLLIVSAFVSIPWLIKSILKTKNKLVARNTVSLFASVALLEYWRVFNKHPATNYVLDQGPFFQLSLMKKEKILNVKFIDEIISRNIQSVLLLTADDDVLWDRVTQRKNHTCRSQSLDKSDFMKFCNEYKIAMNKVNYSNIVEVDTSSLKPNDLYQSLSTSELVL